jgi:hypothetical protein
MTGVRPFGERQSFKYLISGGIVGEFDCRRAISREHESVVIPRGDGLLFNKGAFKSDVATLIVASADLKND